MESERVLRIQQARIVPKRRKHLARTWARASSAPGKQTHEMLVRASNSTMQYFVRQRMITS